MSKRYVAKDIGPWYNRGIDLPLGTKVRMQVKAWYRSVGEAPLEGIYTTYLYGGYSIKVGTDQWTTGVEWFEPLNTKRKIGVFR